MKNIQLLKQYVSPELFKKVGHIDLGPMRELATAFTNGNLTCEEFEDLSKAFDDIDNYWREQRYNRT